MAGCKPQYRRLWRTCPLAIEFNGPTLEPPATGFLVDQKAWSEDLAKHMAGLANIELGERHWDVINYLREEYFENNENQPNTRTIVKAMSKAWGKKVTSADVYDMFNGDPSKIAGKLAGLPESKRKGGY